jgi:hypothetical protein
MAYPAATGAACSSVRAGADTALPSYDLGFTTQSGPRQKAGCCAPRTLAHCAVNGEARRAGALA